MHSENRVRYNPGNAGDLLKHGWLVEVVRFLSARASGRPLRYADTFCGFSSYPIKEEAAERIESRFHVPPFQSLQRPYLVRHRYAGSVTLARLASGGTIHPFLFDKNPRALEDQRKSGEVLNLESGYDILDRDEAYDLVFLDPYDDVRQVFESVLESCIRRVADCSILLFIPFEDAAWADALRRAIAEAPVNAMIGIVLNPGSERDGRFHFASLFLPCLSLAAGSLPGLFGELNIITSRVNALLSP